MSRGCYAENGPVEFKLKHVVYINNRSLFQMRETLSRFSSWIYDVSEQISVSLSKGVPGSCLCKRSLVGRVECQDASERGDGLRQYVCLSCDSNPSKPSCETDRQLIAFIARRSRVASSRATPRRVPDFRDQSTSGQT